MSLVLHMECIQLLQALHHRGGPHTLSFLVAGVCNAFAVAVGSACFSIGGPSMHGNAW